MIYWRHKISKYRGMQALTVEHFRKADWMDVSFGLINFGFSRKQLSVNRRALPNLGFHYFLLKEIVKNLFHHPLSPLPMFRR